MGLFDIFKKNKEADFNREELLSEDFNLIIQGVFAINTGGIVVVGSVKSGMVEPGENAMVVAGDNEQAVKVVAIEKDRKSSSYGVTGENIALHITGVTTGQVGIGSTIVIKR